MWPPTSWRQTTILDLYQFLYLLRWLPDVEMSFACMLVTWPTLAKMPIPLLKRKSNHLFCELAKVRGDRESQRGLRSPNHSIVKLCLDKWAFVWCLLHLPERFTMLIILDSLKVQFWERKLNLYIAYLPDVMFPMILTMANTVQYF